MRYWTILIVLLSSISVSLASLAQNSPYLFEGEKKPKSEPTVNFTWGKDIPSPAKVNKKKKNTQSHTESTSDMLERISNERKRNKKYVQSKEYELKKKNLDKQGFFEWFLEQDRKFKEKYW